MGNTYSVPNRHRHITVHPHTRGEHPEAFTDEGNADGSSPHTWGTRFLGVFTRLFGRFIPTHVGNTPNADPGDEEDPVHPHTRGEHLPKDLFNTFVYGSSPHTWGTRLSGLGGQSGDGSSPHTWGTHSDERRVQERVRFIPTHVGNTASLICAGGIATVHPHTRGEHEQLKYSAIFRNGSSPHTWGTRPHRVGRQACARFIPTHVGNTSICSINILNYPVHPHTRGEHCTSSSTIDTWAGSSPHTWGTLRIDLIADQIRRFIPTHVGNTPSPRNNH